MDSQCESSNVRVVQQRPSDSFNGRVEDQAGEPIYLEGSGSEVEPDSINLLSEDFYFSDCGCTVEEVCLTEAYDEIEDNDENESDDENSEAGDEEDSDEKDAKEDEALEEESSDPLQTLVLDPILGRVADSLSNDSDKEPPDDEDTTCFVATAAFRKASHPDVIYLRRFRDDVLMSTKAGRSFIRVYWIFGPKLAIPVQKVDLLALAFRKLISLIVSLIRFFRGPCA